MKILSVALSYMLLPLLLFAANPVFSVPESQVVPVDVAASTGLSKVFVIYDSDGVRMSVTGNAEFATFGSSGAAYAENRPSQNGTITLGKDDCGIVVSAGGSTEYYWIVNYQNHLFREGSLTEDTSLSDCSRIALSFDGNAAPIRYYSINGRGTELSREITLSYDALVYSEESGSYTQSRIDEQMASVSATLFVPASGCQTNYEITPDRFAQLWGIGSVCSSDIFPARLVEAQTKVTQAERDVDNEKNVETALGGSAPVDISFSAAVTDAAIFHEWQFSKYAEFDDIDRRFTDLDFDYSFTDAGTTYCRLIAANAAGACEYISETFEVFVGESKLECPNAFSPYGTPGINDEWKVSYQSIISFECHIFNRWGKEIFSFNNPAQGWNGKFKGKLVPAGVYYYVINAKGADGRTYKLSGDINLIKAKDSGNVSATE